MAYIQGEGRCMASEDRADKSTHLNGRECVITTYRGAKLITNDGSTMCRSTWIGDRRDSREQWTAACAPIFNLSSLQVVRTSSFTPTDQASIQYLAHLLDMANVVTRHVVDQTFHRDTPTLGMDAKDSHCFK